MKEKYKLLGNYIELVDERNNDLSINNLLGVSINKRFIPSIANIIGTDLSSYKIVRPGQLAYGPVTSRNGEKVSIALSDIDDCIISSSYSVFKVTDTKQLDPQYLMLWFSRSEFDRYARYKSHGSVREIFDWDELCQVDLPIPHIDKQKDIVKTYNIIRDRIELKRKINDNLIGILQSLYIERFIMPVENNEVLPNGWHRSLLGSLCSKIGSGATPTGGKTAYFSEGISLIRSTNVFDYMFSYLDLAHINDIQAKALDSVTVQPFDVLFNITGVSVARCCMVLEDVLPARVNQHVMIIRPIADKNMSFYIMCTLCHNENKQKLMGIGQSGSTREAINKQELLSFEIIVPDYEAVKAFGTIATTLYQRIEANILEINKLQALQEILLARLSGR